MHGTIKTININDIVIKYNPREDFNEKDLTQLAISINKVGLLTPIDVKFENGQFILMDGERRYRAIVNMQSLLREEKLAKHSKILMKKIPCYVYTMNLSEPNAILAQMLKNTGLQLWPWEQGNGFQKLVDLGMKVIDIANAMGKSLTYVYERINFTTATQTLKDAVMNRELNIYEALKTNQEIRKSEKEIEEPTEKEIKKIAEETVKENILEKEIKKRVEKATAIEGTPKKHRMPAIKGTEKEKKKKYARRDGIAFALKLVKRLMGIVVFDIPKDLNENGIESKTNFNLRMTNILTELENLEELFAKTGNE